MTRNSVLHSLRDGFYGLVYVRVALASICRSVVFSLLAVVVLAQTSGCAHPPKSPPQDVQSTVQSLGILAVDADPDVSIAAPTKEYLLRYKLSNYPWFDPYFLILAPIMIPGTHIEAAAQAAPEERAVAAAAAIETAVTEMQSAESLGRRIEKRFRRQAQTPTILLYGAEIPRQDEDIDYESLLDFAVDAILETRLTSINVMLLSAGAPHPIYLAIVVETRLVRVPDGMVLIDRVFCYNPYRKSSGCAGIQVNRRDRAFFKLAEDDAVLFRELLDQALSRLSENIFDFYSLAVKHHLHYKP